MRVESHGNLTVELIRAERFDVATRMDAQADRHEQARVCRSEQQVEFQRQIDRVELSPQAIACDPWATPVDRAEAESHSTPLPEGEADQPEPVDEPRKLSPVVGSPALAGLGAAWVVPGTLLDVVA